MRESGTRHAILGVLAVRGPATGYEVRSAVARAFEGYWSESFGQIYPELRRLAAEGLVEAVDRSGGDGKPFRITAAGRSALLAWLVRPPAPERTRSELQLKLSLGRLMGTDQARAALAAARGAAAERLADLRRRRDQLRSEAAGEQQVFSLLALDRSLAAAAADLAWSEQAEAVFAALEADGPEGAMAALDAARR